MPNIDKDDANATRYEMNDSLDDLIAWHEACSDATYRTDVERGYHKDTAARLVSLRDAEKELPDISGHEVTHVIVDHPNGGDYPVRLRSVLFTKKIVDALRAHAVADRARVKELEGMAHEWHMCVMTAATIAGVDGLDTPRTFLTQLRDKIAAGESAESRVRALEAERDAMMADAKRINAVLDNSWKIDPFSTPTGGGDYEIGWRVIQYHEAKPTERIVAEVFADDPRAAIDQAMTAAMGVE